MVGQRILSAFVAGVIFGIGLCLSRMTDPAVVVGFLDITGSWDPRLLFVMAGALAVTLPFFSIILRRWPKPVCDNRFFMPAQNDIDKPLIIGSILFGIGWGLGGICPGPAVTALAFGAKEAFIFFAALVAGMAFYRK